MTLSTADSGRTGSAVIDTRGLGKTYGDVQALKVLDLKVPERSIFGFLGPNGAGKTTTIRILTGQLRPTAGQAHVMGCDVVSEWKQLKPQIGVVFEHQNLYQRLSALDNLNFSARLYGVPRRRVGEVLSFVGLQDRAKDRLKSYSNGMKQRLLIARALLHGPKVLFLDEPTRGLDPGIARSIRALIKELAQAGMTVFLTTHYMEEADQLCDRVAILDHGRIVALDTPERLKAAHEVSDLQGQANSITLEDVFIQLTGRSLEVG